MTDGEAGQQAPARRRNRAKPDREDRLKAALKANMARRKAQAQARAGSRVRTKTRDGATSRTKG
jgi:hypothetical protein